MAFSWYGLAQSNLGSNLGNVLGKLLFGKEEKEKNLLTDPKFIQSLQVAQKVPALQKMFISEYGEQLDDFIDTPYNSDQYTGAGISPQKFEAMQKDKLNVLSQQLFPQPEPEKPNPYKVLDQMLQGDENITDYERQQFKQMFGVSPDRYYSPITKEHETGLYAGMNPYEAAEKAAKDKVYTEQEINEFKNKFGFTPDNLIQIPQEILDQPDHYKTLENMLQGDNNITDYEAQQFEEIFGVPYTNFYSPQQETQQLDVIAAANDFRDLTSGDNPIPEDTAVRLINSKYGTNFTKEELIKPQMKETKTDLVKAIKDFKDITEDGTIPPATALQAINQKYGTNFTVDDLLISTDVDNKTKQDIVQYYINNPKDFGIAVNQGIVTPEIVEQVNKGLGIDVFKIPKDEGINPYTPTILHKLWEIENYEPKSFGDGVDFSKPKPNWQPYDEWVQNFLSGIEEQKKSKTEMNDEPPNIIDIPNETPENNKIIDDLPEKDKKIINEVKKEFSGEFQEYLDDKDIVLDFLMDKENGFGLSREEAERIYNALTGKVDKIDVTEVGFNPINILENVGERASDVLEPTANFSSNILKPIADTSANILDPLAQLLNKILKPKDLGQITIDIPFIDDNNFLSIGN